MDKVEHVLVSPNDESDLMQASVAQGMPLSCQKVQALLDSAKGKDVSAAIHTGSCAVWRETRRKR